MVGVSLLCLHGAVFLHWRTESELAERARRVIVWSGIIFAMGFIAAGFWLAYGQDGYLITSAIGPNFSANPLAKTVTKSTGLWLNNYSIYPALILVPLILKRASKGCKKLLTV